MDGMTAGYDGAGTGARPYDVNWRPKRRQLANERKWTSVGADLRVRPIG